MQLDLQDDKLTSLDTGATCVIDCNLDTGQCIWTDEDEKKVILGTKWDRMKTGKWYFFCQLYDQTVKLELTEVSFVATLEKNEEFHRHKIGSNLIKQPFGTSGNLFLISDGSHIDNCSAFVNHILPNDKKSKFEFKIYNGT